MAKFWSKKDQVNFAIFLCLKIENKGLRKMSKLFMYGRSLEGIEQLIIMVPNFQPTRNSIVINNYFNCGGECNCNIINVSKVLDKCGYIDSNSKVNVDNKRYKDLVEISREKYF